MFFHPFDLKSFIAFLCDRYYDLGGNIKDVSKNSDVVASKICHQNNEFVLLNWKKKIDEIYMRYKKHLIIIFELLTNWSECKGKLSEARFKSSERVLVQAQLIETQTSISKLSCHLRMFLESRTSINAFRILKSNLDIKVHQVDDDIQRKSNLKKEYEDLKCTEYDEILKKYIDLCNAIKKRNIFIDRL